MFFRVCMCDYSEYLLTARNGRSNSMKYLTRNDQLEEVQQAEVATPTPPSDTGKPRDHNRDDVKTPTGKEDVRDADKFFFPPVAEDDVVEEVDDGCTTVGSSAQSTIRGEYYYKYAVNEGLGHLDKIDSSHINLNTPSECDGVSLDGLREPPVLFSSPECTFGSNANSAPGAFTRGGPKRWSTNKRGNVFAWKLFSSQK